MRQGHPTAPQVSPGGPGPSEGERPAAGLSQERNQVRKQTNHHLFVCA